MRASAAARDLLPQASAAVLQADIAERSGEAIGRRARRAVALGYVGSAPFHPLFACLIQGIEAVRPTVPLRLDQCSGTAQVRYLLEERIDVGIVRSPLPGLEPELASLALGRERMVLARPAAGQWDGGGPASLAAFAGAPFLLYVEQPHGGLRNLTLEACRDAGFEPRIAQTVPQIATMLCLVGAGVGVALVPETMARFIVPGVAYLPLAEAIPTELTMLYRRSDTSPGLRAALRPARRLADKPSLSR